MRAVKNDKREQDLEILCRQYSQAHASLGERVSELHEEIGRIKRKHLYRIKKAAARAGIHKGESIRYVQNHLEEFHRPRTRTFHGVKVGLQTGRGKVVFSDKAATVRAIERDYGHIVDVLLKTTKTSLVRGLQQLDARQLAALGVEIRQTGSSIIVRLIDSEIEKMVDAYLDDEALQAEVA